MAEQTKTSPRASLRAFADEMEARLAANDHKGGWKSEARHLLLAATFEELVEVIDQLKAGKEFAPSLHFARQALAYAAMEMRQWGDADGGPSLRPINVRDFRRELADAANFLHMLHDQEAVIPVVE